MSNTTTKRRAAGFGRVLVTLGISGHFSVSWGDGWTFHGCTHRITKDGRHVCYMATQGRGQRILRALLAKPREVIS